MCIAIPMVARCTSFADDLYMDQGRVSSRAALLLRSTERHPSDPRCVFSLITSFQQLVVGEGVVPPHLFTPYHYQSFTSTHTTHTQQPVFPQHNLSLRPTPRRHSPVGKSRLGRRGAKQRRHASTRLAHLLTTLPLTRPTNDSRSSQSKL